MKHKLNRWTWNGTRHVAVSVVDGAPTVMLCGAGPEAKATEVEPDCAACRRALGLDVERGEMFG